MTHVAGASEAQTGRAGVLVQLEIAEPFAFSVVGVTVSGEFRATVVPDAPAKLRVGTVAGITAGLTVTVAAGEATPPLVAVI